MVVDRGLLAPIAFFLDLMVGKAEAKGGLFLALHDRFMERLISINNRLGNCTAAALVWVWFRLTLLASRS